MNDSFGSTPKKLAPGPKTRVCYVCGRQYGLHSFEIHLKQCKELWIAREAEKDPRVRKPLPEDPMLKLGIALDEASQGSGNGGGGGGALSARKLEEINRISTQAFNTEALSACEFCGRTFLPEKLAIHNKSCTADNPARKVTDSVNRRQGNSNNTTSLATPNKSSNSAEYSTPVRPVSAGKKTAVRMSTGGGAGTGTASNAPLSNRNSAVHESIEGTETDGSVTNLRVEDGNLVGHMGGSSGRPWRSNAQLPKLPNSRGSVGSNGPTEEDNLGTPNGRGGRNGNRNVFNVSEFSGKEEIISYLSNKISNMEAMAANLTESIAEIKAVVEQLKQ